MDTPITGRPVLNLALQGGGSHGAFTWGVLDALLEDGRIELEGLSGTSAGAMNAVALAHGFSQALGKTKADAREAARVPCQTHSAHRLTFSLVVWPVNNHPLDDGQHSLPTLLPTFGHQPSRSHCKTSHLTKATLWISIR
jgi:predicted acylesterase/phospholipase RssA